MARVSTAAWLRLRCPPEPTLGEQLFSAVCCAPASAGWGGQLRRYGRVAWLYTGREARAETGRQSAIRGNGDQRDLSNGVCEAVLW
jgi:hypothetical protein